ncbi:MAG: PhoH family protein [Clostridiales bacterium]|jgi:hypothetical protein|nr:PhoH family protein [Clostridiales bacterium]
MVFRNIALTLKFCYTAFAKVLLKFPHSKQKGTCRQMKNQRITVFAGHYGSGKTNIAVNYALYLKKENIAKKVTVADLDIVNPYFRTNDSARSLTENGIRLISSAYANSNIDAPAMAAETMTIFDDTSQYGVIDLGGDDRGALAIGRYKKRLGEQISKNILLVVNIYRPLSRTPAEINEIKSEIETAAGFKFTGIINNSNLGAKTRAYDVLNSVPVIDEVSSLLRLPVEATCADIKLLAELTGKIPDLFGLKINTPLVLQNTLATDEK